MTHERVLLCLSLALIVCSAIFTALSILRDDRKDGHIAKSGRIAVIGAVVSAVLAIGTEVFRNQIQAEETRSRLNTQKILLDSQGNLLATQGTLLTAQANTLREIKRSLFIFDSITVAITVEFPHSELSPRLKHQWDNYLKKIPPTKPGENPDWTRNGGATLVQRPLPDIFIAPGSPLYPNTEIDGNAFRVRGFDFIFSRSEDLAREVDTSAYWTPRDPPKFADSYFMLKGGQRRIMYNQETGEVDLTATFEHMVPRFQNGAIMSILDLPSRGLILLSDRTTGQCMAIKSVVLAFERAGTRIVSGSTALTSLTQIAGDHRCGGAVYQFRKDDFPVTKEIGTQARVTNRVPN